MLFFHFEFFYVRENFFKMHFFKKIYFTMAFSFHISIINDTFLSVNSGVFSQCPDHELNYCYQTYSACSLQTQCQSRLINKLAVAANK